MVEHPPVREQVPLVRKAKNDSDQQKPTPQGLLAKKEKETAEKESSHREGPRVH